MRFLMVPQVRSRENRCLQRTRNDSPVRSLEGKKLLIVPAADLRYAPVLHVARSKIAYGVPEALLANLAPCRPTLHSDVVLLIQRIPIPPRHRWKILIA